MTDDASSGTALFIGFDLGTSSLKAVAVGTGGEVAARARADYPTARPEPGAAEQSPADWWTAVESAVAALCAGGAPPERWAAIGLSGMIPTLVVTDDDGAPVAPAITWEDGRAEAEGDALRARLGGESLYGLTGQWVDGRYLLPMYLRLARVAPQAARRARHLLGAKDWLFWRLTGEPVTDPSTASGFGCYGLEAGSWLEDVVAAAGVELASLPNWPRSGPIVQRSAKDTGTGGSTDGADRAAGGAGLRVPALPPILPSTATRPLSAAAAAHLGLPAGLPVCLGGADSVLGCLGLGVGRPGDVACVAGTSTVLLGIADRLVIDPGHRYLITPLAGLDGWGFEMDLLTTGSAFRWLAGLLREAGGDEATLMALAAGVEPGAGGLSFLPYLAPGEQGALWDPTISGALFGLSLGHGAADVARALVDGVVLESRRCLAVLDQAGLPRGVVRMAGGSSADPAFRRQLADACRRTVVYGADGETAHSAIGAAALAAMAAGHGPLPAAAPAALETIAPRAAQSTRWDALWERHETALRALRGSQAADGA
jgi:gluconokinase/xylulokinase